jgi:hypothetical protein
LTADQKKKVIEVSDSAALASEVVEQARAGNQTSRIQNVAPPSNDQRKAQMYKAVKEACSFAGTWPDPNSETPANAEIEGHLEGLHCPIQMSFKDVYSTAISDSLRDSHAQVQSHYKVVDPAYRAWNDVIEMSNTTETKTRQSEGGIESSGSAIIHVVSQKYGPVDGSMSENIHFDSQGGSINLVLNIKFPDFTAEGKAVATVSTSGDVSPAYYLNGVQVSEKEFNEVFGGGNVDENTGSGSLVPPLGNSAVGANHLTVDPLSFWAH